jgi:hypothetical protein
MPGRKKKAIKHVPCTEYERNTSKKVPCSPWIQHVMDVWAEMGGQKKGVSYKAAMIAAKSCWIKSKAPGKPGHRSPRKDCV